MRQFDSVLDLCLSEAEVEFKWIVVFVSIDSLSESMRKEELNTCPALSADAYEVERALHGCHTARVMCLCLW